MKNIIFALLALTATSVFADSYVNGYTRSNGTYVQGYNRSDADSTTSNNYSTQGNTNPYTGQAGHTSPTYHSHSNNSYSNY